jgi:hypothetical protein
MRAVKRGLIDWKKQNKIALRNFDRSVDFHDLVKVQLVRMLRRNYPDSKNNAIYTEFDADVPEKTFFADIWFRQKNGDIYVYELQKEVTKQWTEQITKKHESVNLIIVPLKEVEQKLKERISKGEDFMDALRHILIDYVI